MASQPRAASLLLMNDPQVDKIVVDLCKTITEKESTSFRTWLRTRKKRTHWDKFVGSLPCIGMTWLEWFDGLNNIGLAMEWLCDAEVIGQGWDLEKKNSVMERMRWI